MTASGALGFVGGWLFVVFALAPLMSRAFCTRNAPRWAREWRDVAGALVGLHWALIAAGNDLHGADLWRLLAVGAHLAIAQSVVASCNVWRALRRGDRCGSS